MDVFRITDRFKITGRSTVYTIKISNGAVYAIISFIRDRVMRDMKQNIRQPG